MSVGPVADRQKTHDGFYASYALVIAVFAAAILALVTATPSEAKRRPTLDNDALECLSDDDADRSCGGAICYCCYDDGCWICNDNQADCVWDPAYRKGRRPVTRPPVGPKPGGIQGESPPSGPGAVTPPVAPGQPPAKQ